MSLIQLLEETYVELNQCESKFANLKQKLEQVLVEYYEQNPPEYIDQLATGKLVKELIETGKLGKTSITLAKELRQYVVIKCETRTIRGIKFTHVGAREKKIYSANKFADGLTPSYFKQGEFYIVFTTTAGKIHTWHWAECLTEEFAVHINNQLKTPCWAAKNA